MLKRKNTGPANLKKTGPGPGRAEALKNAGSGRDRDCRPGPGPGWAGGPPARVCRPLFVVRHR